MEIKNVLFDLDGTLLPMDMERFTNGYFQLLTEKMAPLGYDPKALIDAVWAGTAAMVKNDGSRLNEEAFWAKFAQAFGPEALADQPVFEAFYANEFQRARQFCGYDPLAAQAVEAVKASGRRVVLATNPIFPAAATRSRLSWAEARRFRAGHHLREQPVLQAQRWLLPGYPGPAGPAGGGLPHGGQRHDGRHRRG